MSRDKCGCREPTCSAAVVVHQENRLCLELNGAVLAEVPLGKATPDWEGWYRLDAVIRQAAIQWAATLRTLRAAHC